MAIYQFNLKGLKIEVEADGDLAAFKEAVEMIDPTELGLVSRLRMHFYDGSYSRWRYFDTVAWFKKIEHVED